MRACRSSKLVSRSTSSSRRPRLRRSLPQLRFWDSRRRNFRPPIWERMKEPCSRRRSSVSTRCSRTRLSIAGDVEVRMARQSDETYVQEIEAMRREKDLSFKEDHESPIPHRLRTEFSGLAYLPVDPKYRIRARLVRDPNPQRVVLATSKGIPRDMIRVGIFEFEVDGTQQHLAAFKAVPQPGHHHEDRSLFVPFRDATSGKDTYGAARYLDIEEQPTDEYVLGCY